VKHPYVMRKLVVVLAVLVLGVAESCIAARPIPPVPDLTAGGKSDKAHDWNLGPTGMRGWMSSRKLETISSRQILVTKVDKGSPSDGVMTVGDVILGAGGTLFTSDARKSFGLAIGQAETRQVRGVLKMTVWRNGVKKNVRITLPVMGSYSDTAPYNCAKSAKILDAGCRRIAATGLKGGIPAQINALALLASGKRQYLPMVRDFARKCGPKDLKLKLHGGEGMVAWKWGYTNLFLTEYYLATGDKYVLPAIQELTTNIARGQSGVGTWGHGMAWPQANGGREHGTLGGYGALNQAGLVCQTSMVLAVKCGVTDKAVANSIERGNKFFAFYIGKGTIPYGDHRPGWTVHDDNGKNSIATVMFDAQNHTVGATFFSRMVTASYGERERGHTGNYFSYLWGPLAASRAGDEAAAAFLKEQRWFYDLGRRADGSFPYQGGAGSAGGEHKYGNWDCTGSHILSCTLPLKKLYITGKNTNAKTKITGADLAGVIDAGKGFSSWDVGIDRYRGMSVDKLFTCLRSWSSAVRYRAATALAEKKTDDIAPRLIAMLADKNMASRYGACRALGAMKARGAKAVPVLRKLLNHRDLWLRIQATYALADIGKPARVAVPDMLKLAVRKYPEDPREFTQRYLCFNLFYPGGALRMTGLISRDLKGVDRNLLYPAVERLLTNDDGRARGTIGSVYKNLTYEEIKPLLKSIHRSIAEPAPSGVMFASGIRLKGLELFARLKIAEGIPLCVEMIKLETWGKARRTPVCLKILATYGGAARGVVGDLKEVKRRFSSDKRLAKLMHASIVAIDKTIAIIESDRNPPKLRKLNLR
jgi:hypothetical protein